MPVDYDRDGDFEVWHPICDWFHWAPGSTRIYEVRSGSTPVPDDTWTDWVAVENNRESPIEERYRYFQHRFYVVTNYDRFIYRVFNLKWWRVDQYQYYDYQPRYMSYVFTYNFLIGQEVTTPAVSVEELEVEEI